jgi:hypothetical protein
MKLRFQFRLRTLMIAVTLLAVACWYVRQQAEIVRERRAMIKRITTTDKGLVSRAYSSPPEAVPSVPWFRFLLGDEPMPYIYLPIAISPATLREARVAFPEAKIRALKDEDPVTHVRAIVDFPKKTESD